MDRTTSLEEVVAIVRDYFAMWTPDEIASLPRACQPGRLRDAEQIEELNRCAVEAFRNTRASGPKLEALQRLTAIVGRACLRIAHLRGAQEQSSEARPNPATSADARGQ